ncbi:DoxX family protein [Nostoc sp. FACHB-152]|uniref:DoxX family protein n=1 Tax=unclassified Nostoc TaxID=2593658 RepID=UPI0016860F86|nr:MULTISPECIES: DoxX family protein [unclassified Nostoc]MBD2450761.1 DoxX family protein [Nostoc sp. FACHB-152]MBD2470200.1 DoxX family protein [Nostoc sp. FACHB-145]
MDAFIGKYSPYIYAILRIVTGLMFAMYGSQKLFGIQGNKPPISLASLMGFGGLIEFAGGLMIALGLLASYAAFITSGEMAVAYFMLHASPGFLPLVNHGELAVLYCFLFFYIAAQGSGIWSVDVLLDRTKVRSAIHT